jgi:ketosteroid isomerase-like protein
MSQENVELVRALIEAVNRDDIDAAEALVAPDVVWEENPMFPGLREVYRGPAEVRAWWEEILEVVENIHLEVEKLTELGDDRIIGEVFVTGRGKGSDAPVEQRVWNVFSFAEGKITTRQVFWTRAEALEAAGLSE